MMDIIDENELINDSYTIEKPVMILIIKALRDNLWGSGEEMYNNYPVIDAYKALVNEIRKQQS